MKPEDAVESLDYRPDLLNQELTKQGFDKELGEDIATIIASWREMREALEEKEVEIAEYRERLTTIKNQAFTALEGPKIREAAKGAPAKPGPPKPPRVKGDRPQA
ncbi:hypothetical protein LCGC14_1896200 [marine sediment metagenome]|uniref:Uncharacterized protein n=1 Tax=marine sediment metagenome TaxID=412755 RepID=A0A0F9GLD8_9ZZZZ